MDNYKRAFVLMVDQSQYIRAFYVLTPIMFELTSSPGTDPFQDWRYWMMVVPASVLWHEIDTVTMAYYYQTFGVLLMNCLMVRYYSLDIFSWGSGSIFCYHRSAVIILLLDREIV